MVLRGVVVLLFILSFPLWLVTSNLRLAVSRTTLFQHEFRKYDISAQTKISDEGLLEVAKALVAYFNSANESIDIQVTVNGNRRQLFNEREVSHLRDVKGLIQSCYRGQAMALAYLLGYFAVSYALKGRSHLPGAASLLVVSSVATIGLFAMAAVAIFSGFDALFLQFHLLSFSNDFWLLDPSRDYLIRIFPSGFFFDASLFIAAATIVEAAVIGGGAVAWLVFARRRAMGVDGEGHRPQ